jgi:hypothetical protein
MPQKLIAVSALPAAFILGICCQIVWLARPISGRYEPEYVTGKEAQYNDLTGYYYPAPEFPLAFDGLSRIDLTTTAFSVNSHSSVTTTPIAAAGYLVTDFDLYKLSSVDIDGGRLSFTTEPRVGVSYEFTGRALEGDYPMKGYSQYYVGKTIIIEGRIVRMLFGFKVAESEVRFTKGSGC